MIRKVHIVRPDEELAQWWEVTVSVLGEKVVLPVLDAADRKSAESRALAEATSRWPGATIVSSRQKSAVVRKR